MLVGVILSSICASAYGEGKSLDEQVSALNRNSNFRLQQVSRISFETYHPQGMTKIGDRIYMTSVQTIDRAKGKGIGHLFEMNISGELLRSIKLGEGTMYHPGGIDYDGRYIWVSVAEYRPNSSSIVYRVNPNTMEAEEMFRFGDHLGGIVSLTDSRELVGVNWGSRKFYRWKLDRSGRPTDANNPVVRVNGSHFIDYQDGQWVRGTDYIVFGGLAGYRGAKGSGNSISLGGLALVNAKTLVAEFEVPISLYSEGGRVMNRNPFWLESSDLGLNLYFIPDDSESSIYVYSVRMRR
jgi:hypothetical protein